MNSNHLAPHPPGPSLFLSQFMPHSDRKHHLWRRACPTVSHPDTCWDTPHCNLTWRTARGCVETVMIHWNLLILSRSPSFYNFARIFANIGRGGERGKKERKWSSLWNGTSSLCHRLRRPDSPGKPFLSYSKPSRDDFFYESQASFYQLSSSAMEIILEEGDVVCYLHVAGAERGKQNQPDCFRFGLVWSV